MCQKTINDINLDNINLNEHITTIPAGSEWYRIVGTGQDPLKPTGRASRFATEPPQYTPEKYRTTLDMGLSAIAIGTGANCFCETLPTAFLEAGGNVGNRDVYKITLKSKIKVVDMDSICKTEGISKPYITNERTEIWHKFYGKEVKGLRFESSKNPKDYNIVIFSDWFPEFKDIIKVEKINE